MSDTASADNPKIFLYHEKKQDQDECELEISINLQEKIGQGKHGIVYAATYYGCECVAKEMHHFNDEKAKDISKAAFLKELDIIQQLKHPNVIDLLEVCYRKDAPNFPILIMSKMSITLSTFVKKAVKKSYLYNKVSILHNISCGLHYLHKKGIIHRDLTINAIFLTEDLCAKIADFGQAKNYTHSKQFTRMPGEFSHMPPEALTANPQYTSKLDIFSFGCVTIQILINKKPIPSYETFELMTGRGYVKAPEIERRREYIKEIKDLELYELCGIIEKCLQNKPEDRPDSSNLLPIIQKYKQTLPKTTEKSKLDLVHELSQEVEAMKIEAECKDRTKQTDNPRWKDHLSDCSPQLARDLAHVADELLMFLHKSVSKDEYYNINNTVNPIEKTELLIKAILTSDDGQMYAKFCDGIKLTKLDKLSEDLLRYLDQKNN